MSKKVIIKALNSNNAFKLNWDWILKQLISTSRSLTFMTDHNLIVSLLLLDAMFRLLNHTITKYHYARMRFETINHSMYMYDSVWMILTAVIWSCIWIRPSRAAALPGVMLRTKTPDRSSTKKKERNLICKTPTWNSFQQLLLKLQRNNVQAINLSEKVVKLYGADHF